MSLSSKLFQQKVIAWHKKFGRHNLPWQKNKTTYRVWISEIMLQQTQVKTVIPYFQKFIKKFPNIKQLAHSKLDTVLQLWAGLGYYSRARNLHFAAKMIVENYHGQFPQDLKTLQTLPGIGRSTAGAILALSGGQSTPILDGNVKRVLIRFYGIDKNPNDSKTIKKLWQLSEKLTPQKKVEIYTQAMMDMGATICTRTKPKCSSCPLQKNCSAYLSHQQNILPIKIKSKKLPTKKIFMLILQNSSGEILLEKRPPIGIWGGLWSLPEYHDEKTLEFFVKKNYGLKFENYKKLSPFRHTFSHFHLDITPIWANIKCLKNRIAEDKVAGWFKLQQLKRFGLPKLIKQLLQTPEIA